MIDNHLNVKISASELGPNSIRAIIAKHTFFATVRKIPLRHIPVFSSAAQELPAVPGAAHKKLLGTKAHMPVVLPSAAPASWAASVFVEIGFGFTLPGTPWHQTFLGPECGQIFPHASAPEP